MIKKNILIVEDDVSAQSLLKKRLESGGYECSCVPSVEEGLKALEPLDPNLVVLDLGLAGVDGTAFLRHAKDWLPPGRAVPPIIVISGHRQKEVINYCLENGAKAFVPKPIQPEAFLTLVERSMQ